MLIRTTPLRTETVCLTREFVVDESTHRFAPILSNQLQTKNVFLKGFKLPLEVCHTFFDG